MVTKYCVKKQVKSHYFFTNVLFYSLSNINPDLAIANPCSNKQTFRNDAYKNGNNLKGSSLILYLIEKGKFIK